MFRARRSVWELRLANVEIKISGYRETTYFAVKIFSRQLNDSCSKSSVVLYMRYFVLLDPDTIYEYLFETPISTKVVWLKLKLILLHAKICEILVLADLKLLDV